MAPVGERVTFTYVWCARCERFRIRQRKLGSLSGDTFSESTCHSPHDTQGKSTRSSRYLPPPNTRSSFHCTPITPCDPYPTAPKAHKPPVASRPKPKLGVALGWHPEHGARRGGFPRSRRTPNPHSPNPIASTAKSTGRKRWRENQKAGAPGREAGRSPTLPPGRA